MSSLIHGSVLRMQSAPTIFCTSQKRRGRSPYLLSVEAEAVKGEQAIPIKLVFVRNRNNRQDYLILVSYLKLGKESRTMSYDAVTAHVSIVLARYMLLSLEQRRKVDKRSIGE